MNATTTACANCSSPLALEQRFCGTCGQRAGSERLTMGHIGRDVLHALTHADHSVFALVKALAYRPGHVAREYVAGRRKKYFGPFAFLVITAGFASFLIVVSGVHFFAPIEDRGAAGFLNRHVNIVILLQIPLLAAWSKLLFWPARLNYAEHLVLAAYTSGFRILFLALITTPIMYFWKVDPSNLAIAPLYYGLWLIYFPVAAVQFYRGNAIWKALRALFAGVLAQVSTIFAVYVFIILFAHFAHP